MKVIREIARGGFGVVEEVELADGSRVARKTFCPSTAVLNAAPLEKLKKRFSREVRFQKQLPSDFFIPILDFDLEADVPWYTMPLCEKNFQTQIEEDKQNGTIPKEALSDILNALQELHAIGSTHRDLNPRNVLIHEGSWKLSDFGLVSPPIDSTSELTTTLAGWGTASHMAPEQASDFKHADSSADIYAFGCILHDIFADGFRIPYSKQTCDGPPGIIVERCTEIDRERRFRTIAGLRGALFSALDNPILLKPSVQAGEWATHLETGSSWDEARLKEFARFVSKIDNVTDRWNIFHAIDEVITRSFYSLNEGYAEAIADEYCDWVMTASFNWDFCDVLVERVRVLIDLGSLEIKARALLAIAKLGRSHNRYFVMHQLLRVCGPGMDDSLAARVSMEIQAEDAADDFYYSAVAIDKVCEDFHPSLKDAIERMRG